MVLRPSELAINDERFINRFSLKGHHSCISNQFSWMSLSTDLDAAVKIEANGIYRSNAFASLTKIALSYLSYAFRSIELFWYRVQRAKIHRPLNDRNRLFQSNQLFELEWKSVLNQAFEFWKFSRLVHHEIPTHGFNTESGISLVWPLESQSHRVIQA